MDVESEHVRLSLLKKDTGQPDPVPSQYCGGKRKQDGDGVKIGKRKRQDSEEVTDSGVESDSSLEVSSVHVCVCMRVCMHACLHASVCETCAQPHYLLILHSHPKCPFPRPLVYRYQQALLGTNR